MTLANGAEVVTNALPLVMSDGGILPLALDAVKIEGFKEDTPLGDAEGMRITRDDCKWVVRAYPGTPFLSTRMT
ncbi:MAG: hypothetical protein ACE5FI_19190, partial [Anaerolineales bacterium]